jgi:hypothetical protein
MAIECLKHAPGLLAHHDDSIEVVMAAVTACSAAAILTLVSDEVVDEELQSLLEACVPPVVNAMTKFALPVSDCLF